MSHDKVTIDKGARSVTFHLNGIDVSMTFTRLRALSSNGLDDAIGEAHGIDMSPEADAELARACGEMEARKTGALLTAIRQTVASFYDDGITDPNHIEDMTSKIHEAVEDLVADDDVVREAYNRDYAKVIEAIDRHKSDIPELDGNSGSSAIDFLATALLESHDEVRQLLFGNVNAEQPGTPAARFFGLLRELEKRFPGAVDKYSSQPPELRLLAAIDAIKAISGTVALPEDKPTDESALGNILFNRGWNAFGIELLKLNPHLKKPEQRDGEQS